ncbi:EAL domain-containing protein [Xylophilus rhododendri]|uniref:EAL domain-containing protein n=1 Tax=Xylophilus rhododendri TaxID=2697032 RepID=A0A857J2U4_9BURK|nr:EAL domain-containing protein [Xylophilus rhododendri]QHI97371.1 EAL domain-containing protein [Xylophilus rhododendri]
MHPVHEIHPAAAQTAQKKCQGCSSDSLLFPFTMAFQPIVDVRTREVFAQEALVRGPNGESAWSILSQVTAQNRYSFDQACRVKAIEWAARLDFKSRLSINFLPNAVYEPAACIKLTLKTAERVGFPIEQIMFEVTEGEKSADLGHLRKIYADYKKRGFITAIDDFGSGYACLGMLAEFVPDVIKIDMNLIRDIDSNHVKRTLVRNITRVAEDLDITLIAEGVETAAEYAVLADLGIHLFQGYLFARPAFEAQAEVTWPEPGGSRG